MYLCDKNIFGKENYGEQNTKNVPMFFVFTHLQCKTREESKTQPHFK